MRTRWARRLQTWARVTNAATSMIARSERMCVRISSGRAAIGQGAGAEREVSGSLAEIWRPEKVSTSCLIVGGRASAAEGPWSEWWAGLGTVAEALEGLGWWAGLCLAKKDGGKCLRL